MMLIKYGKFEMPEGIVTDESTQTGTFARFIVEPFEKGFGHTVGNTLRRIMLSALEAPAILSIRIEGVQHEYMAVDGVVQDMTHIILNLKGALLRNLNEGDHPAREISQLTKVLDVTNDMIEKSGGNYLVVLKDLIDSAEFELVNPNHPIFTVTKPITKRIDLRISTGRGYVPSERHVL